VEGETGEDKMVSSAADTIRHAVYVFDAESDHSCSPCFEHG